MIQLTNKERDLLRKEVTSHAGWADYKDSSGMTSAKLYSSARVIDAARALHINVDEYAKTKASADVVFGAAKPVKKKKATAVPQSTDMTDAEAILLAALREANKTVDLDEKRVIELVKEHAPEPAVKEVRIVVQTKKKQKAVEGVFHKALPNVLRACSARRPNGSRLNVYLVGPAASGKSFAVEQVAKTLDLDYYQHDVTDSAYKVVGYVNPVSGDYHDTPFVKCWIGGGVVLLDEVEKWDVDAAVALNGATASAYLWLPDGRKVKRHDDCVIVCAGNTKGRGSDGHYTAAGRLDESFLSRFVMLNFEYDEALERAMTDNEPWAKEVQRCRHLVKQFGIDALITPRDTESGAALISSGFTRQEAAEMTYLSKVDADQWYLFD